MSTRPRRLDVGTLAPQDAILTIDGVDYEIRGDLPIDGMVQLLLIHKRLQAVTGTSEDDAIEALSAVDEANKIIKDVIRERYPEAQVRNLGILEVTGVLAFLVGDDNGPAAVVEEALVAGIPPPTEEQIAQRIEEAIERDRAIRAGEIEDVPPTTPSRSGSSTPSSISESSTAGGLPGGEESPSLPSVSTASEPTAA